MPWLFVLPFVTGLAPVAGFIGAISGSTSILKTYSSFNATAFLVNIPLTILFAAYEGTQTFYLVVLFCLMFTKIFISFLGSKVRQHLLNPAYIKSQEKLQQRFRNLVSARADILTKGKKMTPAERAAMLVASGTPSESLMGSFAAGHSSEDDGEELCETME